MKFNIGDLVTWQSQALGYYTTKVGTVAAIVPAGMRPNREAFMSLFKGSGVGMSRDHESYVVTIAGKTPKAKAKAYWPRVSQLKPVL